MNLHRPPRRTRELSCGAALVGSVFLVCTARGVASEVISAIPEDTHPSPMVGVDAADAGTPGCNSACRQSCGGKCGGGRCAHKHCGHGACRHEGCEVPGCPAHCPVRPATFGFYDTRWRTWPGHEVVQASHTEPAAPVMPPKSEVPRADEESPVPGFEDTQDDSSESAPADRLQLDDGPSVLPAPGADQRPEQEPPSKPSEAKPADEPAKDKADDSNLFDEADLRQRSQQRLALLGQAALQQERLRKEALRQQATRIMRATSADAPVRQATHVEPKPSRRVR